ncbi:DUF3224 domain-containing protein [Rhodoferax aquaticus]|uniref:DUF3224 domain-containing protein n=1 Tax=Rhodoferax aquaticus TaxID=2527691 RepID=A0A515EKN8_9BURK|nr:DUF3224 domain-containing protein [Rhodoferax aquaticus]QDL53220.1 DUF3224 domain-containing protein [Rhodoferax aquaticus]
MNSTPNTNTPASAGATAIAKGTFDLTLQPQALSEPGTTAGLRRLSIDKALSGDLVGVSQGEMLAYRVDALGSAGYVAMEKLQGTLQGRTGSLVFQHSATMDRGVPTQSITVVPDSGTQAWEGISGRFSISIVQGQHFYEFSYQWGTDSQVA